MAMNDIAVKAVPNGRDTSGRFVPGNKCSKGHAYHKRIHNLRRAIIAASTPKDIIEIIQKLAELAKTGDVAAAKVYLDYVVGRPPRMIELSVDTAGYDAARAAAIREQAAAELMAFNVEQKARLQALLEMPSPAPDGPTDQAAG
jgi:hypothetical protein